MPLPPRPLRAPALLATLSLAAGVPVAAQSAPSRPVLELSAWGAYSSFANAPTTPAGDKATGLGLRSLEVAVWPSGAMRLFGRYDNSLSLDNLTLLRAGRRVPTWSGGALLNWGGHYTTVLQAGRRTLPGGIGQTLLGAEQVVYRGATALKAGVEAGPRADHRTEWVAHAGFNTPVGPALRVEPIVFYARSGVGQEAQWRVLLAAELHPGAGIGVGGGVATGRISGSPAGFDGTVWDAYGRLTLGLGAAQQVHFMVRHERAPGTSDLTSVAAGLALQVRQP